MLILTPDNNTFDMDLVSDQADYDLIYSVLDYSTPNNTDSVDLYFMPMVFVEEFSRPAAILRIGSNPEISIPLDWSILIADKHSGGIEVLDIKHINGRQFDALVYQPVTGFMPQFEEIVIENIYPDVSWTVPKLSTGHFLSLPLHYGENPKCIFVIKDTHKVPDLIDITKIFQ